MCLIIIPADSFHVNLMFRVTNEDGRASAFLTWDEFLCAHYKMRFEVGEYFASRGAETFFPYAEVSEAIH